MKAQFLLSVFFFIFTVRSDDRIFHAKVDGILEPLSSVLYRNVNFVALLHDNNPPVPTFDLKNEVATTEDRKTKKVFGIVNGHLMFGKREKVKPFKVKLNKDSKIKNIEPYLCTGPDENFRGLAMTKPPNVSFVTCFPTEIYLLPSPGSDGS